MEFQVGTLSVKHHDILTETTCLVIRKNEDVYCVTSGSFLSPLFSSENYDLNKLANIINEKCIHNELADIENIKHLGINFEQCKQIKARNITWNKKKDDLETLDELKKIDELKQINDLMMGNLIMNDLKKIDELQKNDLLKKPDNNFKKVDVRMKENKEDFDIATKQVTANLNDNNKSIDIGRSTKDIQWHRTGSQGFKEHDLLAQSSPCNEYNQFDKCVIRVKPIMNLKMLSIENKLKQIFLSQDFKDDVNNSLLNNQLFLKLTATVIIFGTSELNLQSALEQLIYYSCVPELSQSLLVLSSPFQHPVLQYALSQGIVSTVLKDSPIFLTDARLAPGCVGSPVFSSDGVLGIIACDLFRMKHELVTFSLCISFRVLFDSLLDMGNSFQRSFRLSFDMELIESIPQSKLPRQIVLVRSGSHWGSGVILDKNRGIILTCSHVVSCNEDLSIHYLNESYPAKIIFQTSESVFDLAVLSTHCRLNQGLSISFCSDQVNIGAPVYSAGYPVFNEHAFSPLTVSLSRGIISKVTNNIMLQTTCSVHSGVSGGALLNEDFELIGIILCNIIQNSVSDGEVHANVNMSIPISAVQMNLMEFLKTKDPNILKHLEEDSLSARKAWTLSRTSLHSRL